MGTVKSKKTGKKESAAPAITVTDAGENGPKMPEPTNAGPHSETLDKMAEGDAKKRIREYFSNPKNLKKITTQFQREMKELGVNRKVLNQIQEELQGGDDDDEDDTSDSFPSIEEEVEAKEETEEEMLLKHPSKFPLMMLEGQYEIKQELGHGAFGVVSLAITTSKSSLPAGTRVAIKKMLGIFGNPSGTKRLIRELRVLRYLSHHPSITQLLDVKIPKPHDLTKFDQILLVFECMDGDLNSHLKDPKIKYNEGMLKSIMKQIMTGLKYMHSAGFVHRDLKPQNLLILDRGTDLGNDRFQCKLCDFGLARNIHRNREQPKIESNTLPGMDEKSVDKNQLRAYKFQPKITKHVVTRYYRAPEISLLIQERAKLPAIDIWSMGCIMGELLQMIPGQEQGRNNKREILLKGAADLVLSPRTFHNRPIITRQQLNVIFKFLGTPDADYIAKIKNDDLRKWIRQQEKRKPEDLQQRFKKVSPECLDFMKCMLQYDVDKRYDVEQCLKHPWLDVADDDELNQSHEQIVEDFEDVYLNDHQLRLMVVDEIMNFNPRWKESLQFQYGALVNKTKTKLG
jgi:serine/threonine protein kinase